MVTTGVIFCTAACAILRCAGHEEATEAASDEAPESATPSGASGEPPVVESGVPNLEPAASVNELVAPLPSPPTTPFVSVADFPDWVHPGVVEDCADGWCRIPAGCFIYGSPEDEYGRAAFDEERTRVTLTRDFEIQQTGVTQAAWEEAAVRTSGAQKAAGSRRSFHPVETAATAVYAWRARWDLGGCRRWRTSPRRIARGEAWVGEVDGTHGQRP